MGLINVAEKEKESKKLKEEKSVMLTKEVDGVKYFSHKEIYGKWYDNYDEAFQAAQDAKRLKEYKSQGLNENGQSEQQAEKVKAIRILIAERFKLEQRINEINLEISKIKNPDFEFKQEKIDKK